VDPAQAAASLASLVVVPAVASPANLAALDSQVAASLARVTALDRPPAFPETVTETVTEVDTEVDPAQAAASLASLVVVPAVASPANLAALDSQVAASLARVTALDHPPAFTETVTETVTETDLAPAAASLASSVEVPAVARVADLDHQAVESLASPAEADPPAADLATMETMSDMEADTEAAVQAAAPAAVESLARVVATNLASLAAPEHQAVERVASPEEEVPQAAPPAREASMATQVTIRITMDLCTSYQRTKNKEKVVTSVVVDERSKSFHLFHPIHPTYLPRYLPA